MSIPFYEKNHNSKSISSLTIWPAFCIPMGYDRCEMKCAVCDLLTCQKSALPVHCSD